MSLRDNMLAVPGLVVDFDALIWRTPAAVPPPPLTAVMVQIDDPDSDRLAVEWAEYHPEHGCWMYAGDDQVVQFPVVVWAYPRRGLLRERLTEVRS